MPTNTIAPWGELVAGREQMTADDLLALPDDGRIYELVEGRLVRASPSGGGASRLGVDLATVINVFVRTHGLGAITMADGEYVLSKPGEKVTALAPDIAFVRAERVPAQTSPEYDKAWPLAPDLVVEVASPNQYRPEMAAKARLYLEARVRLVWIVWPKRRQIDVWLPGATEVTMTLQVGDTLDGLDVLAGFRYPVERVFG